MKTLSAVLCIQRFHAGGINKDCLVTIKMVGDKGNEVQNGSFGK